MKKSKNTSILAKIGIILSMPIFAIVAGTEKMMAKMFHLTYNEINILVYYLFIPLSWAVMVDYIIGFPILSILFIIFWAILLYKTRHNFSLFCDVAFRASQIFLLIFDRIGWNYVVSSVIICVLVPILIYAGLIYAIMRL